ncbi:ABC transporter permease [Acuticoccus sp. MNP-M23]|uniref:ABC transporter permease n=1 Tax=Acuticoccus sp. MNP-M23 TaxID=3072793 RepID=UPI002815AA48|nr:ABC transporter permease [Acuticoccus sp. MNP-M23]WMS44020.1 ABC transporter permease [Acuticoccus sp. MNP-M23]
MTSIDTAPPAGAQPAAPVAASTRFDVASQWQLTWWSFRRHKLAMFGLAIVLLLYLIGFFAEFVAPFSPTDTNRRAVYHPPQMVRLIDMSDGFAFRPWVPKVKVSRDPISLAQTYEATDERIYLRFFGKGEPYELLGLIPWDRHLLAPEKPRERFYVFGSDRLGRDLFSRTVYATRVSMTIGLVGVMISLVLGLILGGLSGYYGGKVDAFIQRLVEFTLSLPTIPIWLALAAAVPKDWPMLLQYFVITTIVSLVGWTELARVVRGRFLSLRAEDYVVAARLDGASEKRVIFRHMMPALTSHIIASVTLAVPLMILAETSLSFLGLGLQPPAISWGVLLKEAQNVRSIAAAPWLFIPGGFVILAVLCLNFLGDGLRDAADPYAR